MSSVNLSWASLGRAQLSGTDLSYADLSGADFREATVNGANFSGVDLSVILVKGARFSNSIGLKSTEKVNLKARGAILDEPLGAGGYGR